MKKFKEKSEKKQLELSQAEEALTCPDDEEAQKKTKLDELIQEAQAQTNLKHDLEAKLKRANDPQRARERQLQQLKKDLSTAKNHLKNAKAQLEQKRREIMEKAGSAESEETRRTERLKEAEDQLDAARQKHDELKQAVTNAHRAYEEVEPFIEQAKQNRTSAAKKLNAVEAKARGLESNNGGSLAMFGPNCVKVKHLVSLKAAR
jgi:chromosome segregation ATPase